MSATTGAYPLGTEHTPNWVAGYVPSAAEWNMWWSNKVDFDDNRITGGPFLPLSGGTMVGELVLAGMPTKPLDAATKSYVDQFTPVAGPFLPMSGGTMTGTLTLAGNPVNPLDAVPRQYVDGVGTTANQALTTAQAAVAKTGSTMTGPLVLSGNPTSPLGAATKQYVDQFLPLYGGNLTGPVGSSSSIQAQNLYSSSTMLMNAFNSWEWSFSVDGNGSKIQQFRTGWYDVWDGTSGTRSWDGPGGVLMSLDGSGNLGINGQFNAGPIIGASGTFGALSVTGNAAFSGQITANYILSNGNINASGTYTGNAISVSGNISGGSFNTGGPIYGGSLNISGSASLANALAGGYGVIYPSYHGTNAFAFAWYSPYYYGYVNNYAAGSLVPPSTARVKEAITPASYDCLDAVLRTPLFSFIRTGSEQVTPVGFVAEQQVPVCPEMVMQLDDEPFGIDVMTAVAIVYGAVQQLSAKLDALSAPGMKA